MSEPIDIPGLMPYPSVPLKYMPVDDVWSAEYERGWQAVMRGDIDMFGGEIAQPAAKMLGSILGCLQFAAAEPAYGITYERMGVEVLRCMQLVAGEVASTAADEAARVALNKMESEDAE